MPIAPPRNAIHSGRPGGTVSPTRTPVRAALPSPRARLRGRSEVASHSTATAPAVAAAVTSRALSAERPDRRRGHRDQGEEDVAHQHRGGDPLAQEGRGLDDQPRIALAHVAFSLALAERISALATRMSWTMGMPEGQAKLHEPHSTQSRA